MIGAIYALMALVVFAIALQIRIVVLQRRLLEEFRIRKPVSTDGLSVKISCDTTDFDIALKNTTERAQIICAAFESALRVGQGVQP